MYVCASKSRLPVLSILPGMVAGAMLPAQMQTASGNAWKFEFTPYLRATGLDGARASA